MLVVDPLTGNIDMDRGDFFDPIFTIYDPVTGAPKDCTGASFTLTVKRDIDDDISVAIFQLTSAASQFDISGIAAGVVQALGPESYSQALAGDYVYDLEMVLTGRTRTPQRGARLYINKDVTTPGSAPGPPSVGVRFPTWVAFPDFVYMLDQVTGHWVKNRMANNSLEYVSESANPPPF